MKNTIYNLKRFNDKKIIIHHHLGLGDTIICNGLVNYLSSEKNLTCYLPVKEHYLNMVKFLYRDNKNIIIFPVKNETRDQDVEDFSLANKIKILKVGFKKVKKQNFNTYFYKQLKIPYDYSFNYFHIPTDKEKEDQLKKHLFKYYNVKSDKYILIHSESSYQKYELNIESNIDKIYIDKESDLHNNLFLYRNLIFNAEEIHCINGSFLHLVERIDCKAKLYYHHLRKNNIHLKENWNWITYDKQT